MTDIPPNPPFPNFKDHEALRKLAKAVVDAEISPERAVSQKNALDGHTYTVTPYTTPETYTQDVLQNAIASGADAAATTTRAALHMQNAKKSRSAFENHLESARTVAHHDESAYATGKRSTAGLGVENPFTDFTDFSTSREFAKTVVSAESTPGNNVKFRNKDGHSYAVTPYTTPETFTQEVLERAIDSGANPQVAKTLAASYMQDAKQKRSMFENCLESARTVESWVLQVAAQKSGATHEVAGR